MGFYRGPKIVTDGLVLALDAGNTKSYLGSGNTAYSLVGSSTGTLINGVGFNSGNGGSWVFDGVDDYITLTPSITNSIYTLDFWYKTGVNDNTYGYFATDSSTPSKGFAVSEGGTASVTGGTLAYGDLYYYNGSSATKLSQTASLIAGTWYNIVAVFNISSSTIKVYIDGVLDVNQNISSMQTSIDEIGRWKAANTHLLNGNMASYKIYNRVLTADEITQNFNAQKSRFGL